MAFHPPIPEDKQPQSAFAGSPKLSGGLGTLVEAEKLIQIAILLPSAVFIGWLGGVWLDNHFHQSWIGIAGMIFGGISGLVHVIRVALAAGNEADKAMQKDQAALKSQNKDEQ
jgi:F0F1-type ATP synthase assembly protein I